MTYNEIPGWFEEGALFDEQVAAAVDGAHFVEVGSWLGRSTVYMAQKIKDSGKAIRFDAVECWPQTEGAENGSVVAERSSRTKEDLKAEFLSNLSASGVADRVVHVDSMSVEASALYLNSSLDFVFIDADHRYESVMADLNAWWPKIKPGGIVICHDFDEKGPYAAITEFAENNGIALLATRKCGMLRKRVSDESRVFLALPNYGNLDPEMAFAATLFPTANRHRVEVSHRSSSALCNCFNTLWCAALNDARYTHFAMLHADITPQRSWIDILMDELKRTGADIIGVVSPIKDTHGVTSIGIKHPTWKWSPKKRFTMTEIMSFPVTFDAEQAGFPGECLLLNTGCWLADIRNPKWRATSEDGSLKCFFTTQDRIWKGPNGKFVSGMYSEDWFFSAQLHTEGLKAVATRKVSLTHRGHYDFPNCMAWGDWASDEGTRPFWDTKKP